MRVPIFFRKVFFQVIPFMLPDINLQSLTANNHVDEHKKTLQFLGGSFDFLPSIYGGDSLKVLGSFEINRKLVDLYSRQTVSRNRSRADYEIQILLASEPRDRRNGGASRDGVKNLSVKIAGEDSSSIQLDASVQTEAELTSHARDNCSHGSHGVESCGLGSVRLHRSEERRVGRGGGLRRR